MHLEANDKSKILKYSISSFPQKNSNYSEMLIIRQILNDVIY